MFILSFRYLKQKMLRPLDSWSLELKLQACWEGPGGWVNSMRLVRVHVGLWVRRQSGAGKDFCLRDYMADEKMWWSLEWPYCLITFWFLFQSYFYCTSLFIHKLISWGKANDSLPCNRKSWDQAQITGERSQSKKASKSLAGESPGPTNTNTSIHTELHSSKTCRHFTAVPSFGLYNDLGGGQSKHLCLHFTDEKSSCSRV